MDPIIYEQNRARMVRTGMAFGLGALATSILFFTVPYLSLALAGFGIIISFLAKGNKSKYDKEGRIGLWTSLIAIVVSVFVITSVITALKINPEYRKNVSELLDMVYEQSYGETYEGAEGDTIGDLFNELFTGK